MATFFLLLIYLSFIGLGLPDSLLGSAWPAMREQLALPLDAAGPVQIVISAGTIVSSLLSNKIVSRFGPGRVTAVSVGMTAAALVGFSLGSGYAWLIAVAVPLGLGAGAVDAALNNYVALHYSARHMSWLHCFWGVGAFAGPMVFSGYLASGNWRGGYRAVGFILAGITLLLAVTLPLWKRMNQNGGAQDENGPPTEQLPPPAKNVFKLKGLPTALITFLLYCGAELCIGLWAASFLVDIRGFTEAGAARCVSLYYLGITVGRFINGIFASRFTSKALVRVGLGILMVGGVLLAVPAAGLPFAGLALIGFGCAPVYPCMIHETPARFGAENSQKVVGLQMAFAYTGSTCLPPILGLIAARTSLGILPYAMLLLALLMLVGSERLNRLTTRRRG